MIGAILGDVVGSVYEFDNIRTKEFPLFDKECFFTDDTVMTVAVAEALLHFDKVRDTEEFKRVLVKTMHKYGRKYPDAGYGGRFLVWVVRGYTEPYNSCGNGSAMRVSPVGWYATSLSEAISLATASAEVTHNHPEGIKGAVAVAGAIYLARVGKSMEEIKEFVSRYYTIDFTLDEIRPTYEFVETCQESVPQALEAFFESESFEDAIRCAISIGGDSDTIAAITGSIAEAYYGMDEDMTGTTLSYLDMPLLEITERFFEKYVEGKRIARTKDID